MQALIEFFTTIGDAFVALFDFFVKMQTDMVYAANALASLGTIMPNFLTFLPPLVLPTLGITISFVIVFRVLEAVL